MSAERYLPPLFERENSRYIIPTLGTKCPLDIFFGSQKQLHAKGLVVPMAGTIFYGTFSNYNELCTKYQRLSITFYTDCRHPTKGVMFSDRWYNVLTMFINNKNAATASFVIMCRVCLYKKRPSSLSTRPDRYFIICDKQHDFWLRDVAWTNVD